ncbi:AraC family transcriptional regulator [Luteibacter rhizovicinus]|uniref:AraC family transcriptional regulator n=1 Tax=Luteibacter rhizovicinus TaxID=242606 RepID=A0A4V2W3Q1_9GAMM|nr:helix-turn-helix transcriptional regulator [Luteibacter rhizovicinus]TCV92799.1 AraC family transcriptional regulator [Luteibacter rhizovicinus]
MLHELLLQALERADGPPLIAYRAEGDIPLAESDWHRHVRGQFFYVEEGLFITRTESGSWLLPPHRAGWLPPGVLHTVSIAGPSRGWGVFIAPDAAVGLPDHTCVVGANDLLRSLVERAASWTYTDDLVPEQERILSVLLDEIRRAPVESLHLPMPIDRRLRRVALAMMEHPDDTRGIEDWATWAGMSSRTLSRLFRQETQCSVAQWRQQARLTRALERLATGEAVSSVADALGYATPSAFVAMFRKAFGESPGRYLARQAAG